MPLSRADLLNGVEPPRINRKYIVDKPDELTVDTIGYNLGQDVDGPNESARKKLAEEWKQLSTTDQIRLRAIRAKRGISCNLCGNVGYYRENCPNKCFYRPDSPDSMDSTPPVSPREQPPTVGVLWGEMGFGHDYNAPENKAKLENLRTQQLQQKRHFKEADAPLLSHDFLSKADRGYARQNAELNLHQVMRNMIRVLERQLKANQVELNDPADATLLVPPVKMPGETFYPDELSKKYSQYRDYYYAKSFKESTKHKAHMYRGASRTEDALDAILRGGDNQQHLLYEPDPNACQSIHSKLGWKNPLAKGDVLANSDPDQVAKDKQVKQLFAQQGEWSRLQKTAMAFKNDRFDHFVTVLREEIEAEHKREEKILLTESKRDEQHRRAEAFLKQLEAVDRLLRTAESYSFTAGTEEMDYLLFQLRTWRESQDESGARVRGRRADLRKQYEESGLPVPAKLWKITNKDREKGYGPDGRLSEVVRRQREAHAAANRRSGDDDFSAMAESLSSAKETTLENGLQKTVPPHPRPKKTKKKAVGGTGLAASVGGVSPYEMSTADIIVKKRPGQKAKEKKERALAKKREAEEKERLRQNQAEVARIAMGEGPGGNDDDDSSMGSHSAASGSGSGSASDASTFATDVHLDGNGLWRGPSAFESSVGRIQDNFGDWGDAKAEKTTRRAYSKARRVRKREMEEKERARRLAEARGEFDRAKAAKKNKFASNVGVLTYKPTPEEVDEMENKVVREAFEGAGFGTHIRNGGYEQANLHKMPALIPIPKTFEEPGDPALALKSYAARKVMDNTTSRLQDKLSGRIRNQLLPLYVRNTLIEKNGTSVDGDQTQEVLQKDRRYNHTYGRAVAVFENTQGGALSPAERERRREQKRNPTKGKKKKNASEKEGFATNALVRMAFSKQGLNESSGGKSKSPW